MKKPTTTHFAILGLLSARPWSAYDLIGYMRSSYVSAFWSKTEARLYETPKELVKFGYAEASKERISQDPAAKGRERTVYTITRAGRTALKAWLQEPPQPPSFEIEPLLKLAFADQGTIESFLAQIGGIRSAILSSARPDVIAAAGENPMVPSRIHLSAHMADLWYRVAVTILEWIDDLETEASNWETTASTPQHTEAGKAHYRALAQRMQNWQDGV